MTCIELTDFSAYYKLKKEYLVALERITLSVEEGEFLSIVGPSGCGKSTLLKSILGQVELTEGQILVRGKELTDDYLRKANISYISQDQHLYQHLNVYENIAFPLRMAELDPRTVDAKVRAIAERCSIPPYLLNRKPRQLSLGQQQRVALARAFVKKPGLVLADEPFSHLDPVLRQEFQSWIYDYWDETHATVLFVTHDEEEAHIMGGRLLRMDYGTVSPPEDISKDRKAPVRKTVSNIPASLLEKESAVEKKSVWIRLQYRWPLYLLGLIAGIFVLSTLWGRLMEPDRNEKLSVCFVGQDFRAEEAQEQLSENIEEFTTQELRDLSLDRLYSENGTLLAEALSIRCIGDTDVIIFEDDFIFEEIGKRYFCKIPTEIVQQYFPGAVTYEEAGEIYAIQLHSPLESTQTSTFSDYYDGNQPCWLFFTAVSENVAAFNGRGSVYDTAALDLAAYLWRTAE